MWRYWGVHNLYSSCEVMSGQMKKDGRDGVCSTNGREKKLLRINYCKTWLILRLYSVGCRCMKVNYALVVKWHWRSKAKQTHSAHKGINVRIIIKCTLMEWNGRVWNRGKLLLTRQWTLAFTNWEAFFDQSSNYDRFNKDCYMELAVMSQFHGRRLYRDHETSQTRTAAGASFRTATPFVLLLTLEARFSQSHKLVQLCPFDEIKAGLVFL